MWYDCSMKHATRATCADCEPAPTNHGMAYAAAALAWLTSPVEETLTSVRTKIFAPLVRLSALDSAGAAALTFFARIGLGEIRTAPDEKISLRAAALWDSANKLGITMWEFRPFGRANETFCASHKGRDKVFVELPRPNRPLSPGFYWMDNKPVMREKFIAAGIPVALGGSCFTYAQALSVFRRIGGSAIVKPSVGSRSRHTTINVATEAALLTAFKKAKQLSPFALVEQELDGFVYRASVIGGKVVGVISREQPTVRGSGQHTVRQLVEEENRNPKRSMGLFHKVNLDQETEDELSRQGLSWESVPEAGRVVRLNPKVSRGVGAVTVDFTDTVHPENIQLFEKVAAVLDDAIVGIDFIIADIGKSWREQKRCGVIECNSVPFLDLHHSPYSGTPRDASAHLWRLIFDVA